MSLHFGSQLDDLVELVFSEESLNHLIATATAAMADLRAVAGVGGQG
ncbi:hypothetical protein [Actinokineospora diospyrosa]|nr:hypothetical protein [Actinokineospora diospyrosa]